MKRILALTLMCMLALSAHAETCRVYEVPSGQAMLFSNSEAVGLENVLLTLPKGTKVYSADDGEVRLVLTESGFIGYLRKWDMNDTGKTVDVETEITKENITKKEDISIQYITIDPKAMLADGKGEYPASMIRGERTHPVGEILTSLLGENYITKERSEWSSATEYAGFETDKPWETKSVHVNDDGSIWFYDPSVSGERGGEYEPPRMNMLPGESVLIAKGLLEQYFKNGETQHVGQARLVSDRWSYSDRWMTDSEYRDFMFEQDLHYFNFEHRTEDGISILGDGISASVGVNGLNGFDLSWHNFEASEKRLSPMSLENAVALANSTRLAPATLLYASLVYSNWLTENETYNLSWYLVTDRGSYVVDCVQNQHKCDSYEY